MKIKVIQILLFCLLANCFSPVITIGENLTQKHRDYLQKNALLILNDREVQKIREELLYYGKNQKNLSPDESETLQSLALQLNEKIKEMIPKYMEGYRNVPEKYLKRAARAEERRKRYQNKYFQRQSEQVRKVTNADKVEIDESTKRFQSSLQDNDIKHNVEVQNIPPKTSLYELLNPVNEEQGIEIDESERNSGLQQSIPF